MAGTLDNSVFLEDPGVYLRPGVLSSRKALVKIFKSSSLSLSLKLDSLSLTSSLSIKSLTNTLVSWWDLYLWRISPVLGSCLQNDLFYSVIKCLLTRRNVRSTIMR